MARCRLEAARPFAYVIAALPLLLPVWAVAAYSVDVPWVDDWVDAAWIPSLFDGRFDWKSLWIQHNEHRLVLSKLLRAVLALATRWNLATEAYVSVVLVTLTSVCVLVLLRADPNGPSTTRRPLATWALANLMLASLAQHDNLTWAFQTAQFVPGLLLSIAMIVARSRQPQHWKDMVCAFLAALSTLSNGNGFLVWLLVPLCWRTEGNASQRVRLLRWIAGALLTAAFYTHGYAWLGSGEFALHHPLQTVAFFFALIGAPVTPLLPVGQARVAALFGLLLISVFVATLRRLTAKGSVDASDAPWLALSFFGLGSSALVSSRASLGEYWALASRYTTVSGWLIIGMCGLLAKRTSHAVTRGLAVALVLLVTLVNLGAVHSMQRSREDRRSAKAVVLLSALCLDESAFGSVVPWKPTALPALAAGLDSARLLRPPLFRYLPDATKAPSALGEYDVAVLAHDWLAIEGWAVIPHAARRADAVLVVLDDGAGGSTAPLRIVIPADVYAEQARSLGMRLDSRIGFRFRIRGLDSEVASRALKLYAVDAIAGSLLRVPRRETPF